MDPKWAPNGLQIDSKTYPKWPPQSIPKSTSGGPSIDSKIDFKGSLRSVTRSSNSRTERPSVGTNTGPKSDLFLELGRRTLCPSARVVCRLTFVDPGFFLGRPKNEAHPLRARKSAQARTSKVWASRSFCMGLHHSPFKKLSAHWVCR